MPTKPMINNAPAPAPGNRGGVTSGGGGQRKALKKKAKRSKSKAKSKSAGPPQTPAHVPYVEPALHPLLRSIDSVRHDPANARQHNDRNLDVIRESLRNFRQQKPIVVDKKGVVIAGNGTLTAALALGWEWIAAVSSTLKPDEARAFGLVDNRATDLSSFDDVQLADHLAALNESGAIDPLLAGFTQEEMASYIGGGEQAPDEPPEPAVPSYGVMITCRSEAEQRKTHDNLKKRGLNVKMVKV